jgi:hypothetical protein
MGTGAWPNSGAGPDVAVDQRQPGRYTAEMLRESDRRLRGEDLSLTRKPFSTAVRIWRYAIPLIDQIEDPSVAKPILAR